MHCFVQIVEWYALTVLHTYIMSLSLTVVRDGGRVPRIVFRDSMDHLAHQVRAHIGGLRVDATPHAAEHGNGGPTCPV